MPLHQVDLVLLASWTPGTPCLIPGTLARALWVMGKSADMEWNQDVL